MGFEIDQFITGPQDVVFLSMGQKVSQKGSQHVSTCLNLHKIELQMLLKGGVISVTFRALLSN
jgi:hypothetical protein